MKKKKDPPIAVFEFLAGAYILASFIPGHPIDEFDRMTKRGYKLNLITFRYYRPE